MDTPSRTEPCPRTGFGQLPERRCRLGTCNREDRANLQLHCSRGPMPQFTSIQAESAALLLLHPVHDRRPSLRAVERSDEVDQIPDILGAKHAFPCRHYLYSICNTICHHPIREIGRSRDSRQVLRAFGKRGRSGTVPTTLGAMAGRTVLNEQLPSPLDRL